MSQFGLRRRKTPPQERERNRFDRFNVIDLYPAYEAAISTALASMDGARNNPADRDLHLQNVEAQLETALLAVQSMRSRGM